MPPRRLMTAYLLFILAANQSAHAAIISGTTNPKSFVLRQWSFAQAPPQPSLSEIQARIRAGKIARDKIEAQTAPMLERAIKDFVHDNSRIVKAIQRNGCNEADHNRFVQNLMPMFKLMESSMRLSKLLIETVEIDPSEIGRLQREQQEQRRLLAIIGIAQLDFADAALERKCYEWADRIYRNIATIAQDTNITRRARMGVDDVRAARYR